MTGLISYNKNPNIGVVARVNDDVALLPSLCPKVFASAISKELGVEVLKTNICGTSLVGSMTVMNNTGILLPKFVYKKEVEVKLVYYGPWLAGKTSNLEYIYKKFEKRIKWKLA